MVSEGSARDVVQLALRVDRSQIRPLIGIEAACSIAVPLIIGLAVGHPRAGAWAAIGAFLSSFSLYQPGFRIRARIVAVAAVIVGVAVFLGAVTGIEHAGIYPVVAGWTFLGGLMVAIGPNAALVGVVSSVGLLIASSLDATPSLALEDGGLALCGGLGAALLVLAFHRRGQRAEARALATAYRALAGYASGIGHGEASLPEAEPFDTLAATLALPGPHRYLDHADRDRALAGQTEQLRTSLAALSEARARLARAHGDQPGPVDTIEAIDRAGRAVSGFLEEIADTCAADRHASAGDPIELRLADIDRALRRPTPTWPATDPEGAAEVDDHLDEIRGHLGTVMRLLHGSDPVTAPMGAPTNSPGGLSSNGPPVRPARPTGPSHRRPTEHQGPLAGAALALRANLTLESTACRHALRLAAVSTVATMLYRVIDPADGYWIVVAVIFVLKPEFGVTVGRSLLRVIGTLAGVVAATLLLASLQPGPVTLAVLTIVVSAFAFSFLNANYGAFALFLTCLTVFLAAFMGLPAMTAVANRTVDNLIGAGLTVVAFLVWPTWVATQVPGLVASCLRAEGRLGQRVVAVFSDPGNGPDENFNSLISAARLSRSNAEAAVERMAHEPHGRDKGTLSLVAAEGMLAQMHRFGLASLALLHHLESAHLEGQPALIPLRLQLETSFEALADAVEKDVDSPPSGLDSVRQQMHSGLIHGQLQTILVNETDRMAGVVDTTIEIYNASRTGTERPI